MIHDTSNIFDAEGALPFLLFMLFKPLFQFATPYKESNIYENDNT
jgi:hypothetical protein